MHQAEERRIQAGAEARDLSIYSGWRKKVRPANQELLRIYASRLVGQFAGMGEALSLEAVMIALRLEEVPESEQPEMAERLNLLHAVVMEEIKQAEK